LEAKLAPILCALAASAPLSKAFSPSIHSLLSAANWLPADDFAYAGNPSTIFEVIDRPRTITCRARLMPIAPTPA